MSKMKKTGNTPFVSEELQVELEGQAFVTISALNQIRREGLLKLQEEILKKYRRSARKPAALLLSVLSGPEVPDKFWKPPAASGQPETVPVFRSIHGFPESDVGAFSSEGAGGIGCRRVSGKKL